MNAAPSALRPTERAETGDQRSAAGTRTEGILLRSSRETPGRGSQTDVLRALENRHRWLLFAQHCYTCARDEQCELGKLCTYGKKTLKHVSQCKKDECSYPRCALLKPLLHHSRKCQSSTCAICVPVWNYIQRDAQQQNQEHSAGSDAEATGGGPAGGAAPVSVGAAACGPQRTAPVGGGMCAPTSAAVSGASMGAAACAGTDRLGLGPADVAAAAAGLRSSALGTSSSSSAGMSGDELRPRFGSAPAEGRANGAGGPGLSLSNGEPRRADARPSGSAPVAGSRSAAGGGSAPTSAHAMPPADRPALQQPQQQAAPSGSTAMHYHPLQHVRQQQQQQPHHHQQQQHLQQQQQHVQAQHAHAQHSGAQAVSAPQPLGAGAPPKSLPASSPHSFYGVAQGPGGALSAYSLSSFAALAARPLSASDVPKPTVASTPRLPIPVNVNGMSLQLSSPAGSVPPLQLAQSYPPAGSIGAYFPHMHAQAGQGPGPAQGAGALQWLAFPGLAQMQPGGGGGGSANGGGANGLMGNPQAPGTSGGSAGWAGAGGARQGAPITLYGMTGGAVGEAVRSDGMGQGGATGGPQAFVHSYTLAPGANGGGGSAGGLAMSAGGPMLLWPAAHQALAGGGGSGAYSQQMPPPYSVAAAASRASNGAGDDGSGAAPSSLGQPHSALYGHPMYGQAGLAVAGGNNGGGGGSGSVGGAGGAQGSQPGALDLPWGMGAYMLR